MNSLSDPCCSSLMYQGLGDSSWPAEEPGALRSMVERLAELPLLCDPGDEFHYRRGLCCCCCCCCSYAAAFAAPVAPVATPVARPDVSPYSNATDVIGCVIEVVSCQLLGDFLRDGIYGSLQ